MANHISLSKAKAIAEDIRNAVKEIAAKHDIDVRKANMKWDDCGLDMSIALRTTSITGVPQEFIDDFNHFQLAIPKDRLNTTFDYSGTKYTLVGFKRANTKHKYIVQRYDGKMFKFPASALKAAMGINQ